MVSSTFVGEIFFKLLLIIEFLLSLVYAASFFVYRTLEFLISVFTNMESETAKKQKRKHDGHNQTVTNRGIINANWQNLLSSNLLMDNKSEKPAAEKKPNQFTGIFRRAREKKANENLKQNSAVNETVEFPEEIEDKDVNNKSKITKYIAMDCEMVGVGYNGDDHMLARVSLVNKFGDCIYDKFVKAREEVIDYRTSVSGIRKEDMINGENFATVQKEVSELLKGRILVGHSLKNDLSVLFLSHPKRNIRDTSRYKPFRSITKGGTPSLKRLAKEILNIDIQHGEHSSAEDARAAMRLYCAVSKAWEASLAGRRA